MDNLQDEASKPSPSETSFVESGKEASQIVWNSLVEKRLREANILLELAEESRRDAESTRRASMKIQKRAMLSKYFKPSKKEGPNEDDVAKVDKPTMNPLSRFRGERGHAHPTCETFAARVQRNKSAKIKERCCLSILSVSYTSTIYSSDPLPVPDTCLVYT